MLLDRCSRSNLDELVQGWLEISLGSCNHFAVQKFSESGLMVRNVRAGTAVSLWSSCLGWHWPNSGMLDHHIVDRALRSFVDGEAVSLETALG